MDDWTSVIEFWTQAGPKRWFAKDEAFDAEFRERFLSVHQAAVDGQLDEWVEDPEGALALVILLDQFPRNAFRGFPRAFATDAIAREIADQAIEAGHDAAVSTELRAFFYMPFMHSEELADQDRCVALFEECGDTQSLKYAHVHRDVIERFGRFPHRNEVLGRPTSEEEEEFLAGGGFSA